MHIWKRITAASGILLGVILVVTACSSPAPSGSPPASGGGGVKNGGSVTIGAWQEPASFLAAGITDSMSYAYAIDGMSAEGLLWYKGAKSVTNPKALADYWQPSLATQVPTVENGAVKVNSDGTMDVTWHLRQGVKFSDGTDFTSQDVLDTVNFFWLKYGASNPTPLLSTTGWDHMTGVSTPDKYTAVVHWKDTFGPYLGFLSGTYGIVPSHLLQQVWAQGGDATKVKLTVAIPGGYSGPADTMDRILVGTGPFLFKEWVSGDHMTFVKNPNYWQSGKPHLDQVIVKFEPDTNTQLADLANGTIDMGVDFRAALLSPLNHTPNVTVFTIPDSGAEKIDLNLHNVYLSDPVIRQALLLGIDRQAIVDTLVVLGHTHVPGDTFIAEGTGGWAKDPNLKTTQYDPNKAKALLDSAGYTVTDKCKPYRQYKDGSCIALHMATTTGNALRGEQEVLIESNLKGVGIQVLEPFNNVKAGKLFGACTDGGVLYSHAFDMALYTNTLSYPGELDSWYSGYVSNQNPTDANGNCVVGGGQNDTFENNPQVDQDFINGRKSVALNDRKAAYIDAQEQLQKDLPEIPLYQQVDVMASGTKLLGYDPNEFCWFYNSYDWHQ
jgi:peptide/nickel transport system substrate-binding protein